jgi:hypothetical protein
MSAAEYASSKMLPRFQNLRTNVNISVTLQDSSLEKLEKLSSFTYLPSTNFQIETAATAFLCGYLIMKITEAVHGCDYLLLVTITRFKFEKENPFTGINLLLR